MLDGNDVAGIFDEALLRFFLGMVPKNRNRRSEFRVQFSLWEDGKFQELLKRRERQSPAQRLQPQGQPVPPGVIASRVRAQAHKGSYCRALQNLSTRPAFLSPEEQVRWAQHLFPSKLSLFEVFKPQPPGMMMPAAMGGVTLDDSSKNSDEEMANPSSEESSMSTASDDLRSEHTFAPTVSIDALRDVHFPALSAYLLLHKLDRSVQNGLFWTDLSIFKKHFKLILQLLLRSIT